MNILALRDHRQSSTLTEFRKSFLTFCDVTIFVTIAGYSWQCWETDDLAILQK